jgi:hypothetical protein
MSDLMQKLAISKKIMDAHNGINRGTATPSIPMVENYDTPNASYNIPQEYMMESTTKSSNFDPSKPIESDRIMNSKLPDEIKKLMIEQPIVQPSSMNGGSVISNEIIEGAQRLMGMNTNSTTSQEPSSKGLTTKQPSPSNFNLNEMKSMIRDVVRDTVRDVVREELMEAGMLVESTTKSNDIIQFKVGNHLFVGNVTKIKKLK